MDFYSRFIFPRLCDLVMRGEALSRLRRDLLSRVEGEVLEIGVGSGLNLSHYPAGVKKITAVDPNPGMSPLAQKRMKAAPAPVEHRILGAERLPFGDGAFDSVVSAWTLCSIREVDRALKEVYRVLKPEGRFFFLEHGLSEEPKVQKWQRRLTPLNRRLADGCHLDRNIPSLIEAAGFRIVTLDRFYMEKAPKTFGFLYKGTAVRAEVGRSLRRRVEAAEPLPISGHASGAEFDAVFVEGKEKASMVIGVSKGGQIVSEPLFGLRFPFVRSVLPVGARFEPGNHIPMKASLSGLGRLRDLFLEWKGFIRGRL